MATNLRNESHLSLNEDDDGATIYYSMNETVFQRDQEDDSDDDTVEAVQSNFLNLSLACNEIPNENIVVDKNIARKSIIKFHSSTPTANAPQRVTFKDPNRTPEDIIKEIKLDETSIHEAIHNCTPVATPRKIRIATPGINLKSVETNDNKENDTNLDAKVDAKKNNLSHMNAIKSILIEVNEYNQNKPANHDKKLPDDNEPKKIESKKMIVHQKFPLRKSLAPSAISQINQKKEGLSAVSKPTGNLNSVKKTDHLKFNQFPIRKSIVPSVRIQQHTVAPPSSVRSFKMPLASNKDKRTSCIGSTRLLNSKSSENSESQMAFKKRQSIVPIARDRRSIFNARRSIMPTSQAVCPTMVSKKPISSNELKCKYCDKKFMKLNALQCHLESYCLKITANQRRDYMSKLKSDGLNSISQKTVSVSNENSSLGKCQSSAKKTPHSGVTRVPGRMLKCFQCSTLFIDVVTYSEHVSNQMCQQEHELASKEDSDLK